MDKVKQPYYKLAHCPLTGRKYCHYTPRRGPSCTRIDDTCPHFQIRGMIHYCMFHPNMRRLRIEHEQMHNLLAEIKALLLADIEAPKNRPAVPAKTDGGWRYEYNHLPEKGKAQR